MLLAATDLCPKSGLNNLSRWFISLKSEDKKTLGLKLLQVWINLMMVLLVEGKVCKFGLELRIEKTKVAMHIWRSPFLENCKKYTLSISFKKPGKQGLSKKSVLISVQNGLA